MICQSCGTYISLNNTYIVEFDGTLLPVNAKWIACEKCAYDIGIEISRSFKTEVFKRCLKIYNAKEGMKSK